MYTRTRTCRHKTRTNTRTRMCMHTRKHAHRHTPTYVHAQHRCPNTSASRTCARKRVTRGRATTSVRRRKYTFTRRHKDTHVYSDTHKYTSSATRRPRCGHRQATSFPSGRPGGGRRGGGRKEERKRRFKDLSGHVGATEIQTPRSPGRVCGRPPPPEVSRPARNGGRPHTSRVRIKGPSGATEQPPYPTSAVRAVGDTLNQTPVRPRQTPVLPVHSRACRLVPHRVARASSCPSLLQWSRRSTRDRSCPRDRCESRS